METKLCIKCGESKPLDDFGKDRTKEDGLQTYCRRCRSVHYWYGRGSAGHRKPGGGYNRPPDVSDAEWQRMKEQERLRNLEAMEKRLLDYYRRS